MPDQQELQEKMNPSEEASSPEETSSTAVDLFAPKKEIEDSQENKEELSLKSEPSKALDLPTLEEIAAYQAIVKGSSVILKAKVIDMIVASMAAKVRAYCNVNNTKNIVLLGVLQGGARFAHRLHTLLGEYKELLVVLDKVRTESYSEDGQRGEIRLSKPSDYKNYKDSTVLIADDILDSGQTLNFVKGYAKNTMNAATVLTAVLLDKPASHEENTPTPDFLGHSLEGKPWVFGFGMDLRGKTLGRECSDICAYQPT